MISLQSTSTKVKKNWFTQTKSQNLTGQNGQSSVHHWPSRKLLMGTRCWLPEWRWKRRPWYPEEFDENPATCDDRNGYLVSCCVFWDGFFGRRLKKKMNPIPSHCFLAIRLMTNCNFFPWWVYKLRCPRSWTTGLHTVGNFKNSDRKKAGPKTSSVVHHF